MRRSALLQQMTPGTASHSGSSSPMTRTSSPGTLSMEDDNTLVISVDGRPPVKVNISGCTTADEVNERLVALGVDTKVRALNSAEAAAHNASIEIQYRKALITEINAYGPTLMKKALAYVKRKGWALEGMSTDKLESMASYLRPDDYL